MVKPTHSIFKLEKNSNNYENIFIWNFCDYKEDKTDLSKVPSGTYTLRWQSESQQVTKKLLIVK